MKLEPNNWSWRVEFFVYQHADVVKKIRTKRLSCTGHVMKTDDDLPAKKELLSNRNGT